MRIGIHLPQFGKSPEDIAKVAKHADESGYDRIVCGSDLSSDHITALLRPFGFEKRRDETGWEKRLKESGAVKRD